MTEPRVIFRQMENVPSELLRPPPKMTSSPIPSKNYSESPNKSFEKENNINEMTYKTISFASFKPEPLENSSKFRDDFSEKAVSEENRKSQSEVKFQVLMDQNKRLIEIVNESFEEKEMWRSRCEILDEAIKEKVADFEQKKQMYESQKLNLEELRGFQESLREIKSYFYQKLSQVLQENERIKAIHNEQISKIMGLEEELEFKRDLIEKFEVELVQTKLSVKDLNDIFSSLGKNDKKDDLDRDEITIKDIETNLRQILKEKQAIISENERLNNLIGEKEYQIKQLQEKMLENKDFQLICDQLTKKSEKYKSLKLETDTLRAKLAQTQKEFSSLKEKYQMLAKESNERIQTLSLHYEESQKSFETEVERTYEEEKNRLISCFEEERRENHQIIAKLENKLKASENEINDLKDNINMELEELGGKYSIQQDKYKEKETHMANERKRLSVIFENFIWVN